MREWAVETSTTAGEVAIGDLVSWAGSWMPVVDRKPGTAPNGFERPGVCLVVEARDRDWELHYLADDRVTVRRR